jgi:hypothetical protein
MRKLLFLAILPIAVLAVGINFSEIRGQAGKGLTSQERAKFDLYFAEKELLKARSNVKKLQEELAQYKKQSAELHKKWPQERINAAYIGFEGDPEYVRYPHIDLQRKAHAESAIQFIKDSLPKARKELNKVQAKYNAILARLSNKGR